MRGSKKSAWSGVLTLARPYLPQTVLLMVLAVVQALSHVALAMVTRQVIDKAGSGMQALLPWLLALVGVLLGNLLLHLIQGFLSGSTTDRCIADMRASLLEAAARCPEEQLHGYHSGSLLSRGMEDVRIICDTLVVALPATVGQITQLIGAFAAIMVLFPKLAPWLLIACVVVLFGTAATRPVMRRQHKRVRKAEEQVMSGMQENLQQLELIQSLQLEEQTMTRFGRYLRASLDAKKIRRRWSVGISSGMSLVSQVGTGALLLWGAFQVAAKAMSFGDLSAMLSLLSMLRSPVVGLSGIWNRIASMEVAASRLQELLGQAQTPPQPAQVGKVTAVELENVTFCYPGEEAPVLKNYSVRLPLDHWTCLTGISGKGKSTVFKLILGLYTPQQGRVLIHTENGVIPCGPQTRHLFAYVPQDYSLFTGTIRENMTLAVPSATDAQVAQALEVAQAGYVGSLTAGQDTLLWENNTGLSKGQIQRLAVARAVLMDRQVLLLDECTSALDAQTEKDLWQALEKLGKQALLVTHRPEMLEGVQDISYVEMGDFG